VPRATSEPTCSMKKTAPRAHDGRVAVFNQLQYWLLTLGSMINNESARVAQLAKRLRRIQDVGQHPPKGDEIEFTFREPLGPQNIAHNKRDVQITAAGNANRLAGRIKSHNLQRTSFAFYIARVRSVATARIQHPLCRRRNVLQRGIGHPAIGDNGGVRSAGRVPIPLMSRTFDRIKDAHIFFSDGMRQYHIATVSDSRGNRAQFAGRRGIQSCPGHLATPRCGIAILYWEHFNSSYDPGSVKSLLFQELNDLARDARAVFWLAFC
jgi:hypothetical protein